METERIMDVAYKKEQEEDQLALEITTIKLTSVFLLSLHTQCKPYKDNERRSKLRLITLGTTMYSQSAWFPHAQLTFFLLTLPCRSKQEDFLLPGRRSYSELA